MHAENWLDIAEQAARAAGRHAAEQAHRWTEVHQRTAHDVKLDLDRECQQIAESIIREHCERPAILGEEGVTPEAGQPCWIIDPLDGTVNFSHGLPPWCSSVAVQVAGQVVAGAVYVPPYDECYTATVDGPACCNGASIRVSETDRLDRVMIATGLPMPEAAPQSLPPPLNRLGPAVQKVRIMGAAAADLCHVACGRVDAYFEISIRLWDVAAAGLIVRRAGGTTRVLQRYSETHLSYFAGNGRVDQELLALLQ